ncbi:hypothetical protein OG249_26990 [Streptomyces microflavus]|uniref:hypothetical protein n=1 Tax=Streptomyces microflavus TaxID=1919 RepID=UPI00225C1E78|nr:hypothetical protein [Streptomyces microflavus]MCX4655529.1 hypothetical protein [Streptomyces microflavus]
MPTKTDKTTCETCPNPIERTGKRGPAPRFCDPCKRGRKAAREAARRPRKGHPLERPETRKYRPGYVSPNGRLTLVRRIVGDSDRAWFECACGGVAKILHIKNVRSGVTQNCAERSFHGDPRAGRFKGEHAAYGTAHHHVAEAKGRAAEHRCIRCSSPAEHWALLHGEPDIKRDGTGRDAGRPFSINPEQYAPMCRSCHVRWDRAQAKQAGAGLSLAHRALWLLGNDDVEEVTA